MQPVRQHPTLVGQLPHLLHPFLGACESLPKFPCLCVILFRCVKYACSPASGVRKHPSYCTGGRRRNLRVCDPAVHNARNFRFLFWSRRSRPGSCLCTISVWYSSPCTVDTGCNAIRDLFVWRSTLSIAMLSLSEF